jgi:ABC-type nitrate/sulfonate/bicarbonate transport system substrate-binding protein
VHGSFWPRLKAIRREHKRREGSLRKLALTALAFLLASPCWARDKVSLQLKWLHQFQFAGYYAALEQGFYRDAGLDVEIREGGPNIDAMQAVQQGKADFGVCTTSVLLAKPNDPSVVVLGVIFQHSPAVILVPSRAHITTLSDLKGHRLMDTPGSDDLAAMLKRAGVDYKSLPRVQHNGDPRDLVDGKADAMVAYSTNEPFMLNQLGVPYQTFSPRAYGFDFYGDNLCTSAEQIKAHPDRTSAFLAASLKGWDYALAHKEETADLILKRYSQQKPHDALLFEATQSEALIQPRLVPLGSQAAERWQSIANSYRDLGMLSNARLPDGLIYEPDQGRITAWLKLVLVGLALVAGLVVLWLLYRWISRRLELALKKPKLSAIMAAFHPGLQLLSNLTSDRRHPQGRSRKNAPSQHRKRGRDDPERGGHGPPTRRGCCGRPRFLPHRRESRRSLPGADVGPGDRRCLRQLRRRVSSSGDADRRRPPALRSENSADRQLAHELHRRLLGGRGPESPPNIL